MKYTLFETFVGAGGSHLGFKCNGFVSKYVNDFNPDCIKTLLYNNPDIEKTAFVDSSSILDIDTDLIFEKTKIKSKDLDVLFGGIVCKGFSMAGERCPNDERNYFYHKQLELVERFKPKISIIENVPGILNAEVLSKNTPLYIKNEIDEVWKNMENYKGLKSQKRKTNSITPEFEILGKELRDKKETILKQLKEKKYLINVMDDLTQLYYELGYRIKYKILNSASFGAATKRERVIIIAIRNDIEIDYIYPNPTHIDEHLKNKYPNDYIDNKKYLKTVTVNDALATINYNDKNDVDNQPMKHNEKTIARFKYIPAGESISGYIDELPDELKISKFYSRGNTMRLDGNKPSPTLVPGHSNFPVHPIEHRSITVREAACITGFPMSYKFFGSHSKRCEHVGNAVPPPLSNAIAKSIKDFLDRYYQSIKK